MANAMMSTSYPVTIRSAESQAEAHDLWWPLMQELGWNRSSHDLRTHYHSATSNGWLLAFLKQPSENTAKTERDSNEPIGCVVSFAYPNSTGWIGFFCTKVRGRGIGRELFAASLEYFKAQGTQYVGLDAVSEQVATYGRRGFVETSRIYLYAWGNIGDVPDPKRVVLDGAELTHLRNVDKKQLRASDLAHSGLDRDRLWTDDALFFRRDVSGFAVVSTKEEDKGTDRELKAWVLIRSCEKGHRIGPLYATSPELASVVLHAAMKNRESLPGSLIAEVWNQNETAKRVFEHMGWAYEGYDYHRMWWGGHVPEAQQKGGKAETDCFAVFDAGEG